MRKGVVAILGFVWYAMEAGAQTAVLLKQVALDKWQVPSGNYSGITHVDGLCYALVDDKATYDGFFTLEIAQDSVTGAVLKVENRQVRADTAVAIGRRDAEGIAFYSADSTLWISGENDQRIIAHDLSGRRTGHELNIPKDFGITAIRPNYGFEALAYDRYRQVFWTITENVLRTDGELIVPGIAELQPLQLLAFSPDGRLKDSFVYYTDKPQTRRQGRAYAFGPAALCVLDDGNLLIMEREFDVKKRYLRSRVYNKIFRLKVDEAESVGRLSSLRKLSDISPVGKELLAEWSTSLRLFRPGIANYEGMCQGMTCSDGSRTLLLVSDAQGGVGNRFCRLKDWIRVILLPSEHLSEE